MAETASHHWHIYGHDWAIDFLRKGMANQRIRHAYLITGAESVGKSAFARAFAMALNCAHENEIARPCYQCSSCKLAISGNHPDILYSESDAKSGQLKIDAIRDIIRALALKPYNSRYRIAIFDHFDRAQPRAQDALLKTLEEPPEHAILLLLARSKERIMPTITSRCQQIRLRPASVEMVKKVLMIHGADEERAVLLARLSGGRIGWSLNALQNAEVMSNREEFLNLLREAISGNRTKRFQIAEGLSNETRQDKNALRYILELWQTYWRDVLLLAENSPVKPCNSDRRDEIEKIVTQIQAREALKALRATRKTIRTLNTNASARLLLEVMLLDYPGLSYN